MQPSRPVTVHDPENKTELSVDVVSSQLAAVQPADFRMPVMVAHWVDVNCDNEVPDAKLKLNGATTGSVAGMVEQWPSEQQVIALPRAVHTPA